MKIKSEYNTQNNFFDKLLELISEHFMTIAISSIIIILIVTLGSSSVNKQEYDCSSLSKEDRIALTSAVDSRLAMIKDSMNAGLKSTSGFERDDMQDTIDNIMYETRKEFCVPMGK